MSQPQWEKVYSTDYSALYRDSTGVYPPELVIAQTVDDADEDDIEATVAFVYRFPLERCWQITEPDGSTFLSTQDPAREAGLPHPLRFHRPWYADSLASIANSVGETVEDITAMLCSDDASNLAEAYEAIGGYHGYDNLDSYPAEWSASQFAAWPERGPQLLSNERDAFTRGYIACALWCGVLSYEHDDDCPCHEPSSRGDAYDALQCECEAQVNNSSDEHDDGSLTEQALATLTDDAHEFYAEHVSDLRVSSLDPERAGHNFWLTRNRHGAGFWDDKGRNEIEGAALDRLTKASYAYGSMDLMQRPDTKIEVM